RCWNLTRELGGSHEKLIDCAGTLPAFPDRPHDERLSAPSVSGGENLGHRGLVGVGIGRDVTTGVELEPELGEHSSMHRMQVAHRKKHEIGIDLEFRARHIM